MENFKTITSVTDNYHGCYVRYSMPVIINSDIFVKAIKRMGGTVHNLAVGSVNGANIFNGMTWFSVSRPETYEKCNEIAKEFFDTVRKVKEEYA